MIVKLVPQADPHAPWLLTSADNRIRAFIQANSVLRRRTAMGAGFYRAWRLPFGRWAIGPMLGAEPLQPII